MVWMLIIWISVFYLEFIYHKKDNLLIVCYPVVVKPGPRLNIKTVLSMYGDFHVKDKTAVRTSYL